MNFCFLLLVNRSPRSAVLPAVGRFCLCVSTWSLGHEALPCVTTSVGTSSLFFHKVFRIQRSRFRLRTSWARTWSETGRFIFLLGCAIFKVGFSFCFWLFRISFCLVKRTNSCQFGAMQNGLLCWCFFFYFASATDENRVQQVLFSFRFLFCVTDAEGSTACVRDVPHVVRKSNQFSLVPNRRGNISHPCEMRRRACRPASPLFRTSSWLLYRSFLKVGKSREKGICFEFMLWILNEFLRVFLQGGLTGFRFKLLMNDGVDWVSRFTRLVLCSETRTTRRMENGRQRRRRWRASAITFLMPDHARDEFPEDGCAKT